MVCKKLATDDKLKKGYNAMGFSQGGQFLYVYLVQLILTLVDYNLCNLYNVILRINYLISALCGVVTITKKVAQIVCTRSITKHDSEIDRHVNYILRPKNEPHLNAPQQILAIHS